MLLYVLCSILQTFCLVKNDFFSDTVHFYQISWCWIPILLPDHDYTCQIMVERPPRISTLYTSGLHISQIYTCTTYKFDVFSKQIIQNLEANFIKINLSDWLFYLPHVVRHCKCGALCTPMTLVPLKHRQFSSKYTQPVFQIPVGPWDWGQWLMAWADNISSICNIFQLLGWQNHFTEPIIFANIFWTLHTTDIPEPIPDTEPWDVLCELKSESLINRFSVPLLLMLYCILYYLHVAMRTGCTLHRTTQTMMLAHT